MNAAIPALLHKAQRALEAARTLLQEGHLDFAVGRAYYAMFYATEALLLSKDLHFRKHSAVHSAFAKHFIKTGLLNARLHGVLLDAYDRRILGDYWTDVMLLDEEVNEMISQAKEFIKEVHRYIQSISPAAT